MELCLSVYMQMHEVVPDGMQQSERVRCLAGMSSDLLTDFMVVRL